MLAASAPSCRLGVSERSREISELVKQRVCRPPGKAPVDGDSDNFSFLIDETVLSRPLGKPLAA